MKKNRAHRGQSLLEFALAIPLLLFLLMAFIDLGRAVITYSQLSNAAREGTRYAIVHSVGTPTDQNEVIQFVKDRCVMLTQADVNVNLLPPDEKHKITIIVTYSYIPITPGLNLLVPDGSIDLEAQSTALIAPLYQQ